MVEGDQKVALLRHAAEICLSRVSDWEWAGALFDSAIAAGMERHATPKGYADVIASQGRFEDLRDLLVARSEAGEGGAAVEALQDAAIVERNHLNNDPQAVELLTAANAIKPDWFSLRLLRELHYRSQSWEPLAAVLNEMAGLSTGARSARCKVEEGRIREVELNDPDGAAEAYDSALSYDATYMDAFLARVRVARNRGHTNALISLYENEAERAHGASSRFWMARAARAARDCQDQRAGDLYRKAIGKANAEEASIFREAAVYFESVGDADAAYEAMTAEAKLQNGTARAATLLLVGERTGATPNRAVAQLTEAVAADPACAPAVDLAVNLMAWNGQGEAAVGILEESVSAHPEAFGRSERLFRQAEIYDLLLGKPAKAAALYKQALDVDPKHPFAPMAHVRTLRAAGDFEGALYAIRGLAQRESAPDRSSRLWFMAASILRADLNRPDEADAACREALDASTLQPAALDALLDSVERQSDPAVKVAALKRAAEVMPHGADRLACGYRAGRILLDVMGDAAGAQAQFRGCMEIDPHSRSVVSALRAACAQQGQWENAFDLARSEASMVEGDERDWYLLSAAQAAMQTDNSEAQAAAAEVLEGSPSHAGALALIERAAIANNDPGKLVAVYRRMRSSSEDPSGRTALTVRIADLAADANDRQLSARAITRVLEASVGPRPYGAMAKLAVAGEHWALAEAALHADGDEAGLARLLESTSDDQKRVAAAWRTLIKANPGEIEGHHGLERSLTRMGNRDGLAATHGSLAQHETNDSVSTMHALLAGHLFENEESHESAIKNYRLAFERSLHRGKAFDALVRMHCELGETDALNRAFEALSEPDEIGRANALIDAGSDAEALRIFKQAYESVKAETNEASVLPALVRYEQALLGAEKWAMALECLNRRASLTAVDAERAQIQAKQRWLLSERMADSDEAWEFYRQLHEDRPDDSEVLENLARIAGARGESKLAIQFLDGLSNIATTAEDAARYQRRVAEVHASSDDPESARAAFLRALDHNPSDLEALVGLKAIAETAEDWQALVGVLTREFQLLDGAAKEDCARTIAGLWEDRLKDSAVAIDSWRKVLELAPGDQTALEHLVSLAETAGDWASFIDDGQALVHYLEGQARSDLLARMGRAAIQHLRREEEAIRFLDEASASATPSVQAAEDLEQIHAARGAWDRVVECILRRANAATDEDAVPLYAKAAQTRLDQLRDRRGAAEVYDRILRIQPGNV
jgi:tetratricopeptide (TPR) repeat protein